MTGQREALDAGAGPGSAVRIATLALPAAAAVLSVAAIAFTVVQPEQSGRAATILASIAAGAVYGPIGALIVRRRGNPVGWALLGIGIGLAFSDFTVQYGVVAATGALELPGWHGMVMVGNVAFVSTAVGVAVLCLLYPTGTLPGPRWRVALWGLLAGVVGAMGLATVEPGQVSLTESRAIDFPNPLAVEAFDPFIDVVQPVFGTIAVFSGLACIFSLVVRFRRAGPDDRQRIKWLAYVAVCAVLFLILGEAIASAVGCGESCENGVWYAFFGGASIGVPLAVGAAILRHGLYDIEVVIRKTVVVAALLLFFLVVYALVVGGIGALLHDSSNPTLSFAAAALVALLSQPALTRARRFADLVVYGRRATPYEVLSGFSGAMAETRSNEVVLAEMARVVGEGSGARTAEVWLRIGGALHLAAAWPQLPADPVPDLSLVGRELPGRELPDLPAEVAVPVSHDDELLGALTLTMPPSEPATPATHTLVGDLAAQAGLVLRNVQLIEELRASRRRLVSAQDEERRRLERNLHDGAQQQLIALRLRLHLVEAVLADPDLARQSLAELGEAAQAALDDLRDLARGIYPPLLAERGLKVALEGQARKSAIDVRVWSGELGRYPQDTEAAVYFCSLEALQNVAKYAGATEATVRLWAGDGMLSFRVTDDGAGFDPDRTGYGTGLQGMADRLAALGGSLDVDSSPGHGTTVTGRLPVA